MCLSVDLQHKELPLRPGFGREGRPIQLYANHFALKIPEGTIYHYDVEITPSKCPRSLNREVMEAVVKKYAAKLGRQRPVFDGKKNLYTRNRLSSDRVSTTYSDYLAGIVALTWAGTQHGSIILCIKYWVSIPQLRLSHFAQWSFPKCPYS